MVSVKNEKGYVMLLTLVLYAVTLLLCASLFTLLAAEVTNNKVIEQMEITTYIAHSGLEHAVSILKSNGSPVPPLQNFVVYQSNNMTGDYRILELDEKHIVSYGRLMQNGKVICELTVRAQITEDGLIHLL